MRNIIPYKTMSKVRQTKTTVHVAWPPVFDHNILRVAGHVDVDAMLQQPELQKIYTKYIALAA